jgi:F0F1-type ATP synthase epsilon subunit
VAVAHATARFTGAIQTEFTQINTQQFLLLAPTIFSVDNADRSEKKEKKKKQKKHNERTREAEAQRLNGRPSDISRTADAHGLRRGKPREYLLGG